MKTKAILSFILIGIITSMPALNAQTTITIQHAGSDGFDHCSPPVPVWFEGYGIATGYTLTDSVTIYTNFGDGTDTVFKRHIDSAWFSMYFTHIYSAQGNYNVMFIATGPDGKADTLINFNEVTVKDTCGNISGKLFRDLNGDCLFNAGDVELVWLPVSLINNSQTVSIKYSQVNGYYYFNGLSGNSYTIRINYPGNWGLTLLCPPSGEYTFSSVPSHGNDFGLQCLPGFDMHGSLWGFGFRPAFPARINLNVWNSRCLMNSGKAKLVIDDPLLTYVSASVLPDQITGDTLIWNYSNLSNYYYWNWSFSAFSLDVNLHTSSTANLGDTVCATLIVEPVTGDAVPANNQVKVCWVVRNSWDPNMKEVSPMGKDIDGKVPPNTEFTYTIQYQNTGTDTAYNIFILDTLDTDLDLTTLHIIGCSHPMQPDLLPGDILRFNFSNIMLPDSTTNEPLSHGWVSYKISAKQGLADGIKIVNTAGIYFDFNPPVITNTTVNAIDWDLGIPVSLTDKMNIKIYPDPAQDELNIKTSTNLINAELSVMNPFGQVITTISNFNGNQVKINTRELVNGLYFVVLKSHNNQVTAKFIISRIK